MVTPVPNSLQTLLQSAFDVFQDAALATQLSGLAAELYALAYDFRLHERTAEDNRQEHELVVLRSTMRICCRSGHERRSGAPLDASELRVAIAVSLLHDLRFIPRITEEAVLAAALQGDEQKHALEAAKATQRREHMRGSVQDALKLISANPRLLSPAETRACAGYIGLHDLWKLGWPYPPASDWLAVCCLEGDALWPLDPEFGPLADLQRKGTPQPTFEQLKAQALSNFQTQLCAYRANFAFGAEVFQDDETIIRTAEGARMLRELRGYWGI